MLPAKSIHSWKYFMELFIDADEDYNYQELRYEIRNLRKQEGESTSTLFSRFMSIHFRFHEKDQFSVEEITKLFLYLDSHDQVNNDKLQIDDMHIDNCITSSVNIDSRSNIIDPNSDIEIVEHQQILESCSIQFQEQKNMNSTLIFKNHSLVQTIVIEKELMILGPKTESLNDRCINHDFAFSSSQIEQTYLIPSQNISTNQNMDNDFSLESINQDCPMKRGTSNFNL